MEEPKANDRDRPVSEQVCKLRHQEVSSLRTTVNELKDELRTFRDDDLPRLFDAVTTLTTWAEQHDKGHSRSLGILQLVVNLGGWFVALITLIVVLISKYK